MTTMKRWSFAICFLFAGVCWNQSVDLNDRDFETVMDALTLTINYYDLMIKNNGTPDSTFGLAETLGQLQSFIDYVKSHPYSDEKKMLKIIERLENLTKYITPIFQISAINTGKVKKYEVFEDLYREKMWQFFVPQRMTEQKLIYKNTSGNESTGLDEEISDLCMTLLLGTGFVPVKCTVTEFCFQKMTARDFRDYSLTHQLLYFIVAERTHCWEKLHNISDQANQPSPKQMIEIFCSNILRESQETPAQHFPVIFGDLFLEQSTLCGMMGYREFFRPDWIKGILSWQHPSGCFSFDDISPELRSMRLANKNHRIQKRLDQTLDDGCSSHFTSLAITAFGQYLRYIVEDLMKNPVDNKQS